MLTQVRNSLKGVVAWFIVALMILAFAFFGVPDLRNFAQSNALEVGKAKFSTVEVQREFDRQLDLRRQSGEQINRQEAISSGLLTRTLNIMKTRAAITEDARTLGLTSTKEMVADFLQSQDGLKNPRTGKFDQFILDQILRQNSINILEFREDVRSDLVRQQIFNSVASSMNAPEAFVTPLLLRAAETRDIDFIKITADDVGTPGEPTDEALRTYFETNAATYTDPEYRTFQVVILKRDDFQTELQVDEEDIRKLFEIRKSRLDVPETRTIIQISYSNEAEARGAIAKLNTGATWVELAREQSFKIENVTYQDLSASDLADARVAEAVFQAEVDSVVGPIADLFGNYVIATVVSITQGQETNFEDQRETLVAELLQDETTRRLLDAIEAIEVARDEGATISEAIAGVNEASAVTFGPVDVNLITPEGAIINDLQAGILREAFALQQGDESDVVELEDGSGYFMLVVEDITSPALQDFETVRDDVANSWIAAEIRKTISDKEQEILRNITAEISLASLAAEAGLETKSVALTKQNEAAELPVLLVDEIFLSNIGGSISGKSVSDLSSYVVTIKDARFPPMLQADLLLQLYQANAGQLITQELSDAYIVTLQQEVGVKQNDAQLAQAFGLGDE